MSLIPLEPASIAAIGVVDLGITLYFMSEICSSKCFV